MSIFKGFINLFFEEAATRLTVPEFHEVLESEINNDTELSNSEYDVIIYPMNGDCKATEGYWKLSIGTKSGDTRIDTCVLVDKTNKTVAPATSISNVPSIPDVYYDNFRQTSFEKTKFESFDEMVEFLRHRVKHAIGQDQAYLIDYNKNEYWMSFNHPTDFLSYSNVSGEKYKPTLAPSRG